MYVKVIVLAAGDGNRMLSSSPKVLHRVGGRAILDHVLETVSSLSPNLSIIVINEELIDRFTGDQQTTVVQKTKLGTAHAVKQALKVSDKGSDVTVVVYADSPLITSSAIKKLISKLDEAAGIGIALMAFTPETPIHRYGILERDEEDNITNIVEYGDSSLHDDTQLANSGVMAIKSDLIPKLIDLVNNDNDSSEYRLTDIVKIARKAMGIKTKYVLTSFKEAVGVNNPKDLAKAERYFQEKLRNSFLEAGVVLMDPCSTHFSFDTKIDPGVLIYPHVFIGNRVKIAANTVIKPFSVIEQSTLAEGTCIGPFAHLRGNNEIGEGVTISGFTEVKGCRIDKNSTIKHLSYIGDTTVGSDVNIGAGTIVCNFDGKKKNRSYISDECFIGANSTLISPVTLGKKCTTAASSCISEDVPENALAIARSRQINRKKNT